MYKKMDKKNGLLFLPDGFTPASTSINEHQQASTSFIDSTAVL